MTQNKKNIILLSSFILLGSFFRLYNLTVDSYWLDEMYSTYCSSPSRTLRDVYSIMYTGDVHPPIYQMILWCCFKLFGFTEYTGRILSAVIGILCIPAMYLLAKEYYDKNIAIISSLLVSTNYYFIYYSREVRSYSLLVLLSILIIYLHSKVKNIGGVKWWICYVLNVAMLLNTHYFGFLVFGTLLILELSEFIFSRKDFKNIFKRIGIMTCTGALSVAHFIIPMINQGSRESFWIKQPNLLFPAHYFRSYFGFGSAGIIVVILSACFMLFGLYKIYDSKLYLKSNFRLPLFLITVIYFFGYAISLILLPVLTNRNTIPAVIGIILLISMGLSYTNTKIKWVAISIIAVLSMSTSIKYNIGEQNKKEAWRDAIQEVDTFRKDVPVFIKWNIISDYASMLDTNITFYSFGELEKLEKKPQKFYLLDGHSSFSIPEINGYNAVVKQKYSRVWIFEYNSVE